MPVVSSYLPGLASHLGNRVQTADKGRVPSGPAFALAALALILAQRQVLGVRQGSSLSELEERSQLLERKSLPQLIYSQSVWIAGKSRTGRPPSRQVSRITSPVSLCRTWGLNSG